MDDPRIRSVLVVGGGTSGWLSAAYLNRALGDRVTITLIESSAVPRVGVGEATIPTLVNTIRFLGIDEGEWLRATHGTYKAAIAYKHWAVGPDAGDADFFYHPFFDRPEAPILPFETRFFPMIGEGFSTAHAWMAGAARGDRERYDLAASPIPALCEARRFAPVQDARRLIYAYHMDAGLGAAHLRQVAVERGVQHIVDHVEHVDVDERGHIAGVRTRGGRTLEADFYLDCSGFRGLLINQALGEPFDSDARYLPCDRAVAIQAAHDPAAEGLRPYTIAQAHSSGWSWDVPLWHRRGCGYVYSSAHTEPDAAEAELRRHLGDAAAGMDANHLRMRVGRTRRMWVGNCLAVGLSALFLEPLESTSIFFTEYQLGQLLAHFPDRRFPEETLTAYDRVISEMYTHIRDFIAMHYVTTKREDTAFWRTVRHDLPRPDTLQETLDAWDAGLPPNEHLGIKVFRTQSFAAILGGMQTYPRHGPPIIEQVDPRAASKRFEAIRQEAERLLASTPTHYDTIRGLHSGD